MPTFAELVAKAAKLSPEGFAQSYPWPAFVIRAERRDRTDMGFATTNSIDPATGAVLPQDQARVEWVKKREQSNSFLHMITIGRAPNNDVVIDGQGVSKFHAYVLQAQGQVQLVDAGSSFGTSVGGEKLKPREERRPLSGGDVVTIGALALTFHTPATLHAALRASR